MTPYLCRQAVGSLVEGRNTMAWIQANLVRAKKMPTLDELLGRKMAKTDMEGKLKNALAGVRVKKEKRSDG